MTEGELAYVGSNANLLSPAAARFACFPPPPSLHGLLVCTSPYSNSHIRARLSCGPLASLNAREPQLPIRAFGARFDQLAFPCSVVDVIWIISSWIRSNQGLLDEEYGPQA
jgi:hypothetical protein